MGLGALLVVDEFTPGQGEAGNAPLGCCPVLAGLETCLSPQDRRDTCWMCGWSRVELLTMASTRLKTPDNGFGEGGEKCQCLLWHTQQPQCQLLQLPLGVPVPGVPCSICCVPADSAAGSAERRAGQICQEPAVRYLIFNPSILGMCLLLLHASFKLVTFYKWLFL